MFISTATATTPIDLTGLIAKMNDLVSVAAQRDRQAYLGAERQFQDEVAQTQAEYGRCLQALSKERQERGSQVRALRLQADTLEGERHERLKQLDIWVEVERNTVHQRVKQQVLDAAATLAHVRRQREILTDKVDSARALISQYDDLATLLAEVDDQILATAEHELASAELAYQAALVTQADCITAEIKVVEESYKTTKDAIMTQSQADYHVAVNAEIELIERIRELAGSDRAVIARLREERDSRIAGAKAKLEEACLWHSDGKTAVEAERAAEQVVAVTARAKAEAEHKIDIERRAKAKAEVERRVQVEAASCVAEINGLYSARRIAEIVAAAKKQLSAEAGKLVQRAADKRKGFVSDVRQLLSAYPRRPGEGIELITADYAGLFNLDGSLIEIWSIRNSHFAVGDDSAHRKFVGWKPGRIFHQAKQPGCVAFKFGND